MKLLSKLIDFLKSYKRWFCLKKRHRYRVSWITSLNVSLLYLKWRHRQILNVIVRSIASHLRCQLHGCQIRHNRRYHRASIKKNIFFGKRGKRQFSQQKLAVKPMRRGLLHRQKVKTPDYPEKESNRSRYIDFSCLRREKKESVLSWAKFHKKLFYRTDRIQCSMLTSLFPLIVHHQLPKKCERFKLSDDSHDTPVIKLFTTGHTFNYPLGFWNDDSIIYSLSSNSLEDLSDPRCNIKNRMSNLTIYKNMILTLVTSQSYSVPSGEKNMYRSIPLKDEKVYESILFTQYLANSIARSGCKVLEEGSANLWATTAMEIAKEEMELGVKFVSWLEDEVDRDFRGSISAYRNHAFDHVRSNTDLMFLLSGLETYSLLLNDTSKFKKISEIVSYLKSKNNDSKEEKIKKIRMIIGIDMNDIISSEFNKTVDDRLNKIIDYKLNDFINFKLDDILSSKSKYFFRRYKPDTIALIYEKMDLIKSKLNEITNSKGKITSSELSDVINSEFDIIGSELSDVINSELIVLSDPLKIQDNFLERLFYHCMKIWENHERPKMMTDEEIDRVVYGEWEESNNFVMSESDSEIWQDNSNTVINNMGSCTKQFGSQNSVVINDTFLNKPDDLIMSGNRELD